MVVLSLVELSSIVQGDLSKVEYINLSGRNLDSIESMSCCRSLKRICLDDNRLRSLDFLEYNIHLTWISVQNNALEGILDRKPFENLNQLRVLNLSCNYLTNVDGILKKLPSLKTLIITNNCLASIEGLGYLNYLETLILSSNKLTGFEVPKKPLNFLKKLSLSNNKIKSLQFNENVFNIRELRLNGNQLLEMPKGLVHCSHLNILDMGNNCLMIQESVCLETLKCLKHLTSLNLSGNTKFLATKEEWEMFREKLKAHNSSLKIFNSKKFSKSLSENDNPNVSATREKQKKKKTIKNNSQSIDISLIANEDNQQYYDPKKVGISSKRYSIKNTEAPCLKKKAKTVNSEKKKDNSLKKSKNLLSPLYIANQDILKNHLLKYQNIKQWEKD